MSELQYIEVSKIYPHPDNPRKDVGDVSELADSIKTNGILQNLTVIPGHYMTEDEYVKMAMAEGATKSSAKVSYNPKDWFEPDGYTVIIGHRRLAGSKLAGLVTVPCIVREMTHQEQVRTMLLENMQRSDLTVYEQAQGFQMMLDLGETVESIAKDSGFSQTTVRRRVKLLDLDADKFKKAESRGATLFDYMELDKIEDPVLKNEVLDTIGTANFKDKLKQAIETEKFKKRMAQWRADLQEFATEIKQRDYVGEEHVPMDYVRNYGRWTRNEVEKPSDSDDVRYYFRVSDGQIDLYKDHQERVKSEAELRKEALREEVDRKEAELEEITERHFSLRSEFICEFGSSKKFIREISAYAANQLVGDGGWGRIDINVELLATLLDIDADEDTDYDTLRSLVAEEAVKAPEYVLLACAYASEDDEENRYFTRTWNSKAQHYELAYKPNDGLDRLYDFLKQLGYEMSDEEKAMQNGYHELLQTEELEWDTVCVSCKSSHPYCDKCCKSCENHCNGWQECQKNASA